MSLHKKILIFFGRDIKKIDVLKKYAADGYILLPLDSRALLWVSKANLSYTIIDDWISSEERLNAIENATQCGKKWYEFGRHEFTQEGICWPDYDREAMYFFWIEICLANAIAQKIKEKYIQTVVLIISLNESVQIYYDSVHICKTFWKTDLNPTISISKNISITHYLKLYFKKNVLQIKDIMKRYDYIFFPEVSPKDLSNKVIFVINPGEFYRFRHVILRLSEKFQDRLLIITLNSSRSEAYKISKEVSVPVFCEPRMLPIKKELKQKFLQGYQKCIQNSNDSLWEKTLVYLQNHFKYYCENRWPELDAKYRTWLELMETGTPAAVIVSSLADSESQIPAEAAKRRGILTFSIPHGGVESYNNFTASDILLVSARTQQMVWAKNGVDTHRLMCCRNLIANDEYLATQTMTSNPILCKNNLIKILIILGRTGRPDFIPDISLSAQSTALEILSNPPEDLRGKIDIKLKVHPGFPDLEFIEFMNNNLISNVLPIEFPLNPALQWADIIVVLNTTTTAIIHAVKAKKPIIFLYTDVLILNEKFLDAATAKIFSQAGTVVSGSKEFWTLIYKFSAESMVRTKMQEASRNFYLHYLDDSSYPYIDEIIQKEIDNKNLSDKKQS